MRNFLKEVRQSLMLDKLFVFLSQKQVHQHRFSFFYLLGGLTLFFLGIQLASGLLLMIYYSPTPSTAYESVGFISDKVWGGWLVRSIHHWSANLLVVSLLLHLGSTYFLRAYRSPRQMTWVSGILLLFIVLGFCFTGSLLPWDMRAYFATQIGTEIPKSVPLIGPFVVSLLRGSSTIGAESLTRIFALHVAALPLLAFVLIAIHLMLNLMHSSSIPPKTRLTGPGVRFSPDYLFREYIAWTLCLIVLAWLSIMSPPVSGPKADPFSAAPAGIRPEWYFLPMYQTLKLVPQSIAGINGELIINALVALLGIAFLCVPWIDRKGEKDEWNPVSIGVGVIVLGYFTVTTLIAMAG